jgi:hypothetical protein
VALQADDDKKKEHSAPPPKATPPADSSAPTNCSQQEQQASQAYLDIVAPTTDNGIATGVTTASISLDQTIDQVVSILGPPSTVVDLGAKKIYVYKNMKVTFANERVPDVQ